MIRECVECGAAFESDDRRRTLCSKECYRYRQARQQRERKPERKPEPRECRFCGEAFEGRRSHAVYCSTSCRVSGSEGRVPAYCGGCGIFVGSRKPDGPERWCSDRCREIEALRRSKARTASIHRHPLRGPCRECGERLPVGRRMDARYCSDECLEAVVRRNGGSHAGRGPRRIRDPKLRRRVWERDRGICQICHDPEPVDFELRTGRRAFRVDHWVPVVAGGTDDEENLVPSHAECNSWKRDALPEELGLFRTDEDRTEVRRRKEEMLHRKDSYEARFGAKKIARTFTAIDTTVGDSLISATVEAEIVDHRYGEGRVVSFSLVLSSSEVDEKVYVPFGEASGLLEGLRVPLAKAREFRKRLGLPPEETKELARVLGRVIRDAERAVAERESDPRSDDEIASELALVEMAERGEEVS